VSCVPIKIVDSRKILRHFTIHTKVGQYNVGEACASFTGRDLDHCIAGYYGAVAGYQDARVAINATKSSNATNAGVINMTISNTSWYVAKVNKSTRRHFTTSSFGESA